MAELEKDHECGDDCGCGHDHDHDSMAMVTITLENDEELNCAILGNFEVGEHDYIALLPENTDEVLIYRYVEAEDGEVDLQNIESDEEFNLVSDAFNTFMDEMEQDMQEGLDELDALDE